MYDIWETVLEKKKCKYLKFFCALEKFVFFLLRFSTILNVQNLIVLEI